MSNKKSLINIIITALIVLSGSLNFVIIKIFMKFGIQGENVFLFLFSLILTLLYIVLLISKRQWVFTLLKINIICFSAIAFYIIIAGIVISLIFGKTVPIKSTLLYSAWLTIFYLCNFFIFKQKDFIIEK